MMIEMKTFSLPLRAQNNAKEDKEARRGSKTIDGSADKQQMPPEFINIHKINYREKLKQ